MTEREPVIRVIFNPDHDAVGFQGDEDGVLQWYPWYNGQKNVWVLYERHDSPNDAAIPGDLGDINDVVVEAFSVKPDS